MGIHVVMLTGDNQRTAETIRQRLHIPRVIAGVLPQDKEKHIAALQAQGHKVAIIGDASTMHRPGQSRFGYGYRRRD